MSHFRTKSKLLTVPFARLLSSSSSSSSPLANRSNMNTFHRDWSAFESLLKTDEKKAKRYLKSSLESASKSNEEAIKSKDEFIKSKDETITMLVKSNEEAIKSKDEFIKSKDETFTMLVKSNERTIKSMETTMNIMCTAAADKELMLLQTKGLMNLRGMFELLIDICVGENPLDQKLKKANLRTASQKIAHVMSLIGTNYLGSFTKGLLTITTELQCDLHAFYGSLSEDIHGQPWHKNSVRIFNKSLKKNDQLLAERIAGMFSVEVVLDTPGVEAALQPGEK
jgi:hypothetical protein